MRYAMLIYTDEAADAARSESEQQEIMGQYYAFTENVRKRNAHLGGEALGGFYLIEAADLDEAIEIAAQIPGASHGSVEVRPIYEFE